MRLFLGIDIGGTNIKLLVLDSRGREVVHGSIPSHADRSPRDAFSRIASEVSSLGVGRKALIAAGVACAGLVDPVKGRLHSSPNLPAWQNAPLSRIASEYIGVHTIVDNDANAAAYGEYYRGCGRGRGTLVCITLGTGVGGAIVTEGRLLRGSRNFAGEIGHMTLCETGPRCHCGNRGCLEAYLGAYALVREARRLLARRRSRYLGRWVESGQELTPRLIAEAASSGDRIALRVFEEAATHLGIAVANVVNIFNPDVVAIAGGVAQGFHLMKPRVQDEMRKRAFPESSRVARIMRARLGTRAAAIGSALLARQSVAGTLP